MITSDDVLDWITASTGTAAPTLTTEQQALLDRVVDAVVLTISKKWVAPSDTSVADWEQAHLMAAARLWDRRRTVDGLTPEGEFGPIRINRFDTDIEALLEPYERRGFG